VSAEPLDRCLSLPKLARRWGCRVASVRRMVRDGTLRAISIGGRVRVTPEAIRQAEEGPLAVCPRVRRRREGIDPEIVAILGDP
jgi:hypothetical protein